MKKKIATDATSRDAIIFAAIEEFSRSGFHGARVDSIAQQSGINKAMIYYHFKNKEELYRTIIEQLFTGIHSLLKESTELDIPPNEKLYQLIGRISAFASSLDDRMKKLMMWEIASGGKTFIDVAGTKFFRLMLPLVSKLYNDGIKSGIFRKDINPVYTHITIVSAIIFSNIINLTAKDSVIFKIFFEKNFNRSFTDNLISIIKKGIEEK